MRNSKALAKCLYTFDCFLSTGSFETILLYYSIWLLFSCICMDAIWYWVGLKFLLIKHSKLYFKFIFPLSTFLLNNFYSALNFKGESAQFFGRGHTQQYLETIRTSMSGATPGSACQGFEPVCRILGKCIFSPSLFQLFKIMKVACLLKKF